MLVGRGAACALACQPGCFHIFVYATLKAKRDWFTQAFPKQAQNAEQALAAYDKRRAAVIRKFYQQEWCSRGLYHMLLNSAMGIDAMIAAVSGAAELEIGHPVAASQFDRAYRGSLLESVRNSLTHDGGKQILRAAYPYALPREGVPSVRRSG